MCKAPLLRRPPHLRFCAIPTSQPSPVLVPRNQLSFAPVILVFPARLLSSSLKPAYCKWLRSCSNSFLSWISYYPVETVSVFSLSPTIEGLSLPSCCWARRFFPPSFLCCSPYLPSFFRYAHAPKRLLQGLWQRSSSLGVRLVITQL